MKTWLGRSKLPICFSMKTLLGLLVCLTLQMLCTKSTTTFSPPTIEYQFCTNKVNEENPKKLSEFQCEPNSFISNSTFRFGKVDESVIHLSGSYPADRFLRLVCSAPYPILWLSYWKMSSNPIKLVESDASNRYHHDPLSNTTFSYVEEVSIQLKIMDSSNVLRCVSYSNSNLSAETYIKLDKRVIVSFADQVVKSYYVDGALTDGQAKNRTSLIVPCVSEDDNDTDFRVSKLTKYNLTHVEGYSPGNTSYDHRIGFWINEQPDVTFAFRCISRTRHEMIQTAALRLQVPADLLYLNDQGNKSGIYCTPRNELNSTDLSLKLWIKQCHSPSECQFLWKAYPSFTYIASHPLAVDLLYDVVFNMDEHDEAERVVPEFNHGYVHCTGWFNTWRDKEGWRYFYSEIDYWFTGLDGLRYMVNKGFPMKSIIALSAGNLEQLEANSTHYFNCKISTFVLLRNIQFVLEYSGGKLPTLLRIQTDSPNGAKISTLSPDGDNASVTWQLELRLSIDLRKVVCYAPWQNSSSWARAEVSFHVRTDKNKNDTGALIWISMALIVVTLMTVLLLIVWRKYKRALSQNLTHEEVEEFHQGSSQNSPDDNPLESLPFRQDWIIPSSSLVIENLTLGEGEFGIVQKGMYNHQAVAVKSSKKSSDLEYFRAFLKEIKVMGYIGQHKNVVQFLGAVVDKIEQRKCFAVLELSPIGNLNKFLRNYAAENDTNSMDKYKRKCSIASPQDVLRKDTNLLMLISFCKQIAEGMDYISQKKVIHGDLAARNVLVFSENTVKITDFGLSRKLYSCAIYVKKSQDLLPWRWMALESLRYLEFSTQSDVWSFGVTVWEVFTMASVPFSDVNWSAGFIEMLECGLRLPKPRNAPQPLFDWVLKCWEIDPSLRPTFSECTEMIGKLEASWIQASPTQKTETSKICGSKDHLFNYEHSQNEIQV